MGADAGCGMVNKCQLIDPTGTTYRYLRLVYKEDEDRLFLFIKN
jgi:hypothetical protein